MSLEGIFDTLCVKLIKYKVLLVNHKVFGSADCQREISPLKFIVVFIQNTAQQRMIEVLTVPVVLLCSLK